MGKEWSGWLTWGINAGVVFKDQETALPYQILCILNNNNNNKNDN